nr:DUF4124 domain-containing protein [Burkholderiaceae bacterium]
AAQAQDVYRCEDNGRIVFSDKPCPGGQKVDTRPATGGKAAPAAPAAAATPTPAPAGAAPAPRAAPAAPTAPTAPAPARPADTGKGGVAPGVGYATREQACAGGNARACEEIACLRDERDACDRIGGLRGSGWYEASRHTETHRGQNDLGKTTLRRVLILTIKCTGNPPRGGDILIGRGNDIALRSGSTKYSSVDTAAAALCKR